MQLAQWRDALGDLELRTQQGQQQGQQATQQASQEENEAEEAESN